MTKQKTFDFTQARGKKAARNTIAFRLDEDHCAELSKRAASLGVSPHELARHYVMEVLLEGNERVELRRAVNALAEHVREARKDIALSTEALLISAGTLEEKEAENWTRKNLNLE